LAESTEAVSDSGGEVRVIEVVWRPHHTDEADVTITTIDPRAVDRVGDGVTLLAAAVTPGVGILRDASEDGTFSLLLFEVGHPDGSWAACDYEPGKEEYEVTQYGDRRLWDEFCSVWLRWQALGEPGVERFGLTVTAQGQQVWIDQPQWILGSVMASPVTTRGTTTV
jgi:protein-L-isoaspartate(D-aspartate) O-methyltransferase